MGVTTQHAPMAATGMDVFTAGAMCAVHFYSRTGTHVFHLPLQEFVQKARRDVDGNRRFFPRGEPSPVTPPPSGRGKRGTLPPARLAAYQAARRDSESGACTIPVAAARYGVQTNSFRTWLRNERAKEQRKASAEGLLRVLLGTDEAAKRAAADEARALLGLTEPHGEMPAADRAAPTAPVKKRMTCEEAARTGAAVRARAKAAPELTQKEIAAEMGLSPGMVGYHLSRRCKVDPRAEERAA